MAKVTIHPPLLVIVSAGVSFVLNSYFPVALLFPPPINNAGILIVTIAIVVMVGGWLHFLKNKTSPLPGKNPKKLIKNGPYSVTRNPLSLCMVLALLGFGVFLGNLSAFLGPVIFALCMDKIVIPQEEERLKKSLGKEYLDYLKAVPRWL